MQLARYASFLVSSENPPAVRFRCGQYSNLQSHPPPHPSARHPVRSMHSSFSILETPSPFSTCSQMRKSHLGCSGRKPPHLYVSS